jgi:hypothetical protein
VNGPDVVMSLSLGAGILEAWNKDP